MQLYRLERDLYLRVCRSHFPFKVQNLSQWPEFLEREGMGKIRLLCCTIGPAVFACALFKLCQVEFSVEGLTR